MKTNESGRTHEGTKPSVFLRLFILVILLLIICGNTYGKIYRRKNTEPTTSAAETTMEELRSLRSLRQHLTVAPRLKRAAFQGRATEPEYGTYLIPGLMATETQIYGEKGTASICSSMTPQGLVVSEDYVFISAYCYTQEHNSVVYVIDKQTHEFVKEIVLQNKSHVGGLAYDPVHKNLWITCMSRGIPQLNAISLSQIEKYSFQEEHLPIKYSMSYDLYAISRCSFMTYHNGALYVGYFTTNSSSVMEEYKIQDGGMLVTETIENSADFQISDNLSAIALPSDTKVISNRVQGVTFYKDKMIFSQSYGIFPSKLEVYQDTYRKLLEEQDVLKSFYFPERLEQIYADGDDLYILFESGAYGYRGSSFLHCDRVLKLNLTTLLQ